VKGREEDALGEIFLYKKNLISRSEGDEPNKCCMLRDGE
jgi:hypothetical protein